MTTFWHVELTWHDGMVTEVTWYPVIGPLGAPTLTESMLVLTVMPVSLPDIADPRVRAPMTTV